MYLIGFHLGENSEKTLYKIPNFFSVDFDLWNIVKYTQGCPWNLKHFEKITPGLPMSSKNNSSQLGPAVWPAIGA